MAQASSTAHAQISWARKYRVRKHEKTCTFSGQFHSRGADEQPFLKPVPQIGGNCKRKGRIVLAASSKDKQIPVIAPRRPFAVRATHRVFTSCTYTCASLVFFFASLGLAEQVIRLTARHDRRTKPQQRSRRPLFGQTRQGGVVSFLLFRSGYCLPRKCTRGRLVIRLSRSESTPFRRVPYFKCFAPVPPSPK